MNKALIPQFIADTMDNADQHGNIEAVVLFLDISGFTPLTTRLMSRGKPGAEIISSTLNRIFTPMIEAVHEHGGFVSGFAGDAFTAVFPVDGRSTGAYLHATAAALTCQATANREHMQHTRFGEFPLEISAGLGTGELEWGVVGTEDTLKSWYFRGVAIDEATLAEAAAHKGEIRTTPAVSEILTGENIGVQPDSRGNGYDVVPRAARNALGNLSKAPTRYDGVPAEGIHRFFRPIDDLPADTAGEFREVTSVFIAADAGETYRDINTTVTCVLRSTRAYGGYFDVLDFGDKGCVMLIAFGAPLNRGKDTERALSYAVDVLDSLGYRARIGISRGTVFTGYVGSPERATYTTLGESVNIAARIAVGNEPQTAYADLATMKAAGREVSEEASQARSLKGYEKPVRIYPVAAPGATIGLGESEREDSDSHSPDPFLVGREKELGELAAWLDTVLGVPGVA
ncbi:MAG: adenylate/guanylate cyclase domain-containing protein, partial [Spirochaetales bacterium]